MYGHGLAAKVVDSVQNFMLTIPLVIVVGVRGWEADSKGSERRGVLWAGCNEVVFQQKVELSYVIRWRDARWSQALKELLH